MTRTAAARPGPRRGATVLLEERRAQLGQLGRALEQRPEDLLPLVDLEGEDPHLSRPGLERTFDDTPSERATR
jgi:hypothetical protein